ncbi:MAG: insulinase family protein, partial [Xanthomonadales bacterium]|nr:insulinase family protein [Xanthomonadales bacterium]
ANATLVLVGDITPEQAKAKALKYFGEIPSGPPVAQVQPWTFPRTSSTRGTMHSDVPQVRIYREWNTPHSGTKADNLLSLAASVLGGDKTSRLYQRLVYQDKVADSVSVSDSSGELASQFELEVHVKHGADVKKVEAAIAEVWQQFLKDGPTEDELNRAKTGFRAYMVRRIERVGGFGGKATLLAAGQVYHNDPGQWRKDLAVMMAATPEEVRDSARKWLSQGDYTLTVLPLAKGDKTKDAKAKDAKAKDAKAKTTDGTTFAGLGPSKDKPKALAPVKHEWHTVKSDVDRSKGVPQVSKFPDLDFPKMQHATLDNGIKVTFAERHSVPLVEMRLQFNAGYAADQGRKLGAAAFTMAMLDEGTKDLDSVEIAKRKQRLGAFIRSGCGLDTCSVTLNALADKLTPSLDLLADIVRNPAFRADDVTRIRGQWLAGIKQEKARPMTLALRVAPPLLYGKDHAYGIPFTGTGTASSITSLIAADMRSFMHDFIRPDNVTILVTGDTKLDPLVKRLNNVFGQWKAPDSAVPKKNIAHVDKPGKVRVYLMDRPGSLQSVILAGIVSPSTEAPNHLDIKTMNGVFGGTFTSRLNMNLREDKHWAYGAHSFISSSVGQSPFLMYAAVQTDKTAPSVSEILQESKAIIGPKPPTDAEIEKIKQRDVRAMPGQYQTNAAVLSAMASNVLYDRPDDYVQTLKSHINGLKDKNIEAAAKQVIQPEHLTWVIVGDLKKIEKPVRALKLGTVKVLDDNGKIVR